MFLLGLAAPLAAHAGELDYIKRGTYWEGVKAKPVASHFGLELISTVADYQDQAGQVGREFRALYFLQQSEKICLVARERDNRRYYWLNQGTAKEPWASGERGELAWPTEPVIKPLGLKLYDLGALVRLDCAPSSADERIAPVILYQSQAPKDITGYVFTFKLNEGMKLKAHVYQKGSNRPLYEQDLRAKRGPGIFDVVWPAANHPAGDYTLVLDGYRLSNNDKVYQAAHFYHYPHIQ